MRERELKPTIPGQSRDDGTSLPMRERELKPLVLWTNRQKLKSLPMRERELKPVNGSYNSDNVDVAPHAGA